VIYGSYVDELLAILPASGVVGDRKFVHSNHLYSVAALTDNSGNVVERYRYDAYGQRTVLAADGVTVRAGSSYGNQSGWTGRYHDRETGLIYFRTRYHSTSLGRFLNRQPWFKNNNKLYAAYLPIGPVWMERFSDDLTYSYGKGRYNLYDIMMTSPGNYVEPFSNPAGAAVGAGIGEFLIWSGAVVWLYEVIMGDTTTYPPVVDTYPPYPPPADDPWYKDPLSPKEPHIPPKPKPKETTDIVPPISPPKNPPKDYDGESSHPCAFECSCCPPKMMPLIIMGFKGPCPYSYDWVCPDSKKPITCYLKGAKR